MTAEQQPSHTTRGPRRPLPSTLLAGAVAAGAVAVIVYAADGYSKPVFLIWIAAIVTLALVFESRTARLPRVTWHDVVVPGAIIVALSPFYVLNVYQWPVQVGSDEVAIMTSAERWADRANPDLFGLSDYLSHPALLFVVWGKLGQLFGSVDLGTMRALHGAVGLLAVAASYALFRQLLERRWAVVATLLLGLSHSLFMISRLAMRENTSLLVEVLALALLLRGLRYNAPFPTFLGGLVAGLGYYVYQPARVTILLWLLFLAGLALLFRQLLPLESLRHHGAIALGTFALVAAPIVIAELEAPSTGSDLSREALLIFSEARALQQDWVSADTQWEGIRTNIGFGLGAFNNNVVDHGWQYINSGHGFVDPLTGVLLWVGVAVVGVRLVRRQGDPWSLLPLTSFLTLWLAFALLVNKAPNYTRLLITLPFVAYFGTEAIRFLAEIAPRIWRVPADHRRRTAALVAGVVIGGVVAWNVHIATEYVQRGREAGDDIGSTGRYIDETRDRAGMSFHMATSDEWPYYVWGFPSIWLERMRTFAHDGQVGDIVPPDRAGAFKARSPFVLFMSRDLWERAGSELERRYPRGRLDEIVPDGRLVAFRTPTQAARSRR